MGAVTSPFRGWSSPAPLSYPANGEEVFPSGGRAHGHVPLRVGEGCAFHPHPGSLSPGEIVGAQHAVPLRRTTGVQRAGGARSPSRPYPLPGSGVSPDTLISSPKTGGQRVEKSLETVSAVSFISARFTNWIPAPRFHEDNLRGNDPPEADRGFGGVPQPRAGVIARSEATKQSRGGVMRSDERVDCRAFSSLGLENGSQRQVGGCAGAEGVEYRLPTQPPSRYMWRIPCQTRIVR